MRWSGYEMAWVRDGLGTSWFGYELTHSRPDLFNPTFFFFKVFYWANKYTIYSTELG